MCCAVVVVSHIERDANNSNSIDILLLLFPINALLREHECILIYKLDRSAFRRHACPAVWWCCTLTYRLILLILTLLLYTVYYRDLVDPSSSHMLVSKTKPCMPKSSRVFSDT